MYRYHIYALTDDNTVDTFNQEFGSPTFTAEDALNDLAWLTDLERLIIVNSTRADGWNRNMEYQHREYVHIDILHTDGSVECAAH